MKAYEFTTEIGSTGTLEIPEEILESLPSDRVVRGQGKIFLALYVQKVGGRLKYMKYY
jgi:hypothetical protein